MGVPGVPGVCEVSEGEGSESIIKGKYPFGPWRMGQEGVVWSDIILSGSLGDGREGFYGAEG